MSPTLALPATQACVFALGCALIHAFRDDAAAVTRILTGLALLAAVLVLLGGSLLWAPDDPDSFDDVSLWAGLSG